MSDYTVMVRGRAKVFLGGPPLVKMATGEESEEEELGGADMHARVSGLCDHLAVDEPRLHPHRSPARGPPEPAQARRRADARRLTRRRFDPDEILGIVSRDLKIPFDPREVIARVVDGSRFEEFKALYGTNLVTGWASIHGYPVGILANHRGVLLNEESDKAAEFIMRANQVDTPLVFLQNTTGYMVGRDYEQRGIIKDGAKMINAVTNSTVPHFTIQMGSSYGAGNYGMCGRAYDPRFLFTWPSARTAIMGGPSNSPASCRSSGARPPPRPAVRSTTPPTRRSAARSRTRSRPSPTCSRRRRASTTTG